MNAITKMLSSLSLELCKKSPRNVLFNTKYIFPAWCISQLHTTTAKSDLMQFFDKKENWGATEVKVGRAWKKEELRIKSNSDLHKLWFVLLKERNMLMTMEHEANDRVKLFPNPERIDKVKESMENLESVVRERNRAYFELETGETGERPSTVMTNPLGLHYFYRMREYVIPKFMNNRWHARHYMGVYRGYAVSKFLKLYREKLSVSKKKAINRQRNHVIQLIKRFPNLDQSLLEEKYPDVNVREALQNKKTRGHHQHNVA